MGGDSVRVRARRPVCAPAPSPAAVPPGLGVARAGADPMPEALSGGVVSGLVSGLLSGLVSGHLVDLILALVAAEAVALIVYWRLTGRGIPTADLTPNLLSGACLLLALRAALGGWSTAWIALSLACALMAHLVDLRRRWRPE